MDDNKDCEKILIVEDSPSVAVLYEEYLAPHYSIHLVESGEQALAYLQGNIPNLVILDINLPDMSGMEVLKHIYSQKMPVVTLVVTGHGTVDLAVEAMGHGAYDFLEKPFSSKRLLQTISNALSHQKLSETLDSIKDNFSREGFEGFVGSSLPMQAVYRIIESAASSQATIFITGESGTGKEVCAEAVHNRSDRSSKSFVALNCGAIPRDLMESEIFGHTKGAFTGAVSNREGAAARANGGTLFLDELCEMDMDLQTKLLRFIQSGSFQKVGSNQVEHVDVRFVCATNKDPLEEVKQGRFREDLYYRLHVIPIHIPPLRDRAEDVALLMDKLLGDYAGEENKSFSSFSPEAQLLLQNYDWPGNVRQLQNVIRNIVVLNEGEQVSKTMIPPPLNSMDISQISNKVVPPVGDELNSGVDVGIEALWIVEKNAIERAIAFCDGNIPKAAALLDVSASTIYRKRERWASNQA